MNEDRHVAMPKLYGAPAYARPPVVPVNATERPFDPDDLPIESERTTEDEALVSEVRPQPHDRVAATPAVTDAAARRDQPRRRPLRLRLPGRR